LEELLFAPDAGPPDVSITPPSGDPWADEAYALGHCHGFVVADRRGTTGVVSDVRFLSRADRPDELEVTTGHIRGQSVWVPTSAVEGISPDRTEIALGVDLPWCRPTDRAHQLLRLLTGWD
jgi:hypothetical protein